jgi:N-terminal acetyltransferase B complex non-catalytic subunit
MSELSVSERRIKPIHDAIEGENWKQALQICEKWQKKGEKSDHFQVRTFHELLDLDAKIFLKAIKAFVLAKQHDAATRQRGIDETVSLCRRTPAVTDLAALHQIQDSLKDLSLSAEEGTTLWDRAVAAKPDDKDLAMTWLNRSIAENNWQGAQKVC